MKRTFLWVAIWLMFMSISVEATFADQIVSETPIQSDDQIGLNYVDYELLSIPTHKQEKNKWCWAASSQMVIDYLGGNETQRDIVVKGSLLMKEEPIEKSKKGINGQG